MNDQRSATKLKVLLLCPHLTEKGGVAHYYSLVKKHFAAERIQADMFHTGMKSGMAGPSARVWRTVRDLVALAGRLPRYDLVVLNPSLDLRAVIRDGLYHLVAKRLLGKRTVIFFHGWDCGLEQSIERSWQRTFRYVFGADKIVVLARQFRDKLLSWGFSPAAVHVETTTYESPGKGGSHDMSKIVFLSRFSRGKGCLEAIRTIEKLVPEFPALKLYMAGEGELTEELKEYVTRRGLEANVEFTGWLGEAAKRRLLQECGTMLYPTNYGEGMPICLLEGMGAGLAVITRPVAGIADIFTEGKNGYLVESLDPEDFAAKLKRLLNDRQAWEAISAGNRQQAEQSFEIRSVVKRLERLFLEAAT